MVMGCNGCLPSEGEKQEDLIILRSIAKQKAKENGKAIAIIEDCGELHLCDAEYAVLNHCIIKEVVSNVT
jgi:hypothetical protein